MASLAFTLPDGADTDVSAHQITHQRVSPFHLFDLLARFRTSASWSRAIRRNSSGGVPSCVTKLCM